MCEKFGEEQQNNQLDSPNGARIYCVKQREHLDDTLWWLSLKLMINIKHFRVLIFSAVDKYINVLSPE